MQAKILDDEIIEEGEATLMLLKQRFEKNKQFPAMGNSITKIMQVSNDVGGNKKLTDIILQDQSLTSKILSIVNSSMYNQFGSEIKTISRAVVILGIDQIQSTAISIMVFEKMNKGPMATLLKSYACQSFLSAYFAKKLVENIKSIDFEEAFLISMFHNLGKQVVLYFIPEKYNEILNFKTKNECDEEKACLEILGVNYTEIGQFIALELQLPKNIILGIQAKPKTIKQRPTKISDYLGQLASLTNEILESAACGDNEMAEKNLKDIIERYKASFILDYEKTLKMLEALSHTLLSYSSMLDINPDENPFCKNFIDFINSQIELGEEQEPKAEEQ